jgi:hypothetical protein
VYKNIQAAHSVHLTDGTIHKLVISGAVGPV